MWSNLNGYIIVTTIIQSKHGDTEEKLVWSRDGAPVGFKVTEMLLATSAIKPLTRGNQTLAQPDFILNFNLCFYVNNCNK